ncbi:MAG: ABC transporter ATP-binding protein, partial [Halobacteriovoraceae bacterium]|nr:ABC transporter ATP-binding protein [Halobacteriovoraceae bacterium]
PATSGKIQINGLDITEHRHQTKTTVGVLPENPPLYLNMKVRDYLNFCQRINSFSALDDTKVVQVLERCGLWDVRNRLIGNLSKGYKQRVAVAQTMVFGPEIIVLDEPTVGLDPNAIGEMRILIQELKKDHTILLSTHQLHEVARICDDLTIISKGKILKTGTLQEVQSEFSAFKTYDAVMNKVSDELKKTLMSKSFIQGMDSLSEGADALLRIRVQGEEDYRPQLTSLLTQHGSLLEFKEKKMELEEIFKEVVG